MATLYDWVSGQYKQGGTVNPNLGPVTNGLYQQSQNEISGLQSGLNMSPMQSYVAKDYSAPLPEYDQLRQQTSQNLNSQQQSNQDALDRKFAANGMSNSGSAIKATQINNQQSNENRATAMNNIGFQEAQQRRSLQQGEENKAFQSGEQAKNFNATYSNQLKMQLGQMGFDNNSKIVGLDMASQNQQLQSANDQYNQQLNAWQQQHSGGLLGAGGVLGTGLGF